MSTIHESRFGIIELIQFFIKKLIFLENGYNFAYLIITTIKI